MHCMTDYHWADPKNLLQVNTSEVDIFAEILLEARTDGVVPAVRMPLTAAYWLDVPTQASAANRAKYPNLSSQYQSFVRQLVDLYTSKGIVVLLDLHWNDDDSEQQPMATKGKAGGVTFWDSIASTFGENSYAFYELYNEPHTSDFSAYLNGDDSTSGMLEMLAAVRKHTSNPVVIAGQQGWAYDADSLVQVEQALQKIGEQNVMYNFHPYMGPNQAGAANKCPAGFEGMVTKLLNETSKPIISTEFGQACCSTNGACESCPGTFDGKNMGYDESIISISVKYGLSWLPWAWRSGAAGPNAHTCQDVNGGISPPGLSLAHPTDGKGADFQTLWTTYAKRSNHSGTGCPGGSMAVCMGRCPSTPPSAYKSCVTQCAAKCS